MPFLAALKKRVCRPSALKERRLILAALLLFLFLLALSLIVLARLSPQAIARGIAIGPFDMSGLTSEQALKFLQSRTSLLEERGLDFFNGDRRVNLSANVNALSDPELAYVIFKYNSEEAVASALDVSQKGTNWQKFWQKLSLRLTGRNLPLNYFLDEAQAEQFLRDNFSFFENSAKDAGYNITVSKNEPSVFEIAIEPETGGQIFDYAGSIRQLRLRLAQFDSSPIVLALQTVAPQVTASEAEALKPQVAALLAKGALILVWGEENLTVPVDKWSRWIKVVKINEQAVLDIDEKLMAEDIKLLAPSVNQPVEEAKFAMQNDKVMEFSPGVAGVTLNAEKTKMGIIEVLFGNATSTAIIEMSETKEKNFLLRANEIILRSNIMIDKTEPLTQVAGLNEMGIKEIIGVGRSDFRGSPPNRIHNIKTGAAELNGILIAPGEVFSLLKALGKIDAERGYRPELVIKGNKTVPELGGGLCQIGTTTFRVTLASGLPILERQSHAYRVSYYEPPVGVDATIYNPRPDFRFLNDTGHYILIQTRLEGTELIFEFWGTLDGRQATRSEPIVFNRTSPPSAKLIETLDLPVGKKKCAERAHAGADAVFTYTITYIDGAVKTQEFKSHYRPWGEVCMIGVEKLSTTSTPATAPIQP